MKNTAYVSECIICVFILQTNIASQPKWISNDTTYLLYTYSTYNLSVCVVYIIYIVYSVCLFMRYRRRRGVQHCTSSFTITPSIYRNFLQNRYLVVASAWCTFEQFIYSLCWIGGTNTHSHICGRLKLMYTDTQRNIWRIWRDGDHKMFISGF